MIVDYLKNTENDSKLFPFPSESATKSKIVVEVDGKLAFFKFGLTIEEMKLSHWFLGLNIYDEVSKNTLEILYNRICYLENKRREYE